MESLMGNAKITWRMFVAYHVYPYTFIDLPLPVDLLCYMTFAKNGRFPH